MSALLRVGLPAEAIHASPTLENFCGRIEHAQIREGGLAMIHGDQGTGKSVALRLLADRLTRLLRPARGSHVPAGGGAALVTHACRGSRPCHRARRAATAQ